MNGSGISVHFAPEYDFSVCLHTSFQYHFQLPAPFLYLVIPLLSLAQLNQNLLLSSLSLLPFPPNLAVFHTALVFPWLTTLENSRVLLHYLFNSRFSSLIRLYVVCFCDAMFLPSVLILQI